MLPVRSFYVALCEGDIEGLGVVHGHGRTRLVLYDRDYVAPLLHALLTPCEREELIRALQDAPETEAGARRAFRAVLPAPHVRKECS